jgi:hypothetical protein
MKALLTQLSLFLILLLTVYLISYVCVRQLWVETWEKDGHDYVIFPKSPVFPYYFYRPVAVLDGQLTGMRFHIGPHQ